MDCVVIAKHTTKEITCYSLTCSGIIPLLFIFHIPYARAPCRCRVLGLCMGASADK